MRFNRRNWNKYFDGSNKVTTIRLHSTPCGHKKAWAGSYTKPELLGEFDLVSVTQTFYGKLTEEDAKNDGFKSLKELQAELTKLNGKVKDTQEVFIHHTVNVKRTQK